MNDKNVQPKFLSCESAAHAGLIVSKKCLSFLRLRFSSSKGRGHASRKEGFSLLKFLANFQTQK